LTDKVLYNKAQAYVGLGEYKEAEKILTSLAKKDNKNEKILNLLAYIYEKTDQLEQAMKLYDEIYKITKKSKYKESIERVQEKIKKQELEKSGG
jgi:predicted Zn-dependent protease